MRQIIIGDKKSYDDWGLFLQHGWVLEGAQPKSRYIDVPASDGVLDLTETLAGQPRYENRTFQCGLILPPPREDWEDKRREISNYCNGRRMKIYTPDDLDRYLMGRISVGSLSLSERGMGVIHIMADCDPFLYKRNITEINLEVDGTTDIVLVNARRNVIPEITTGGSVEITINGARRNVGKGTYLFADFILREGKNQATFRGHTGVKITYQEADL